VLKSAARTADTSGMKTLAALLALTLAGCNTGRVSLELITLTHAARLEWAANAATPEKETDP
jgi:uncharacterized lipoprotein YmbA